MATVKMCKLRLIAAKPEKKPVLELLTRSGCFEVSAVTDENLFSSAPDADTLSADEILKDISKLSFAIEYINQIKDEAAELNAAFLKSEKKAGRGKAKRAANPFFKIDREKGLTFARIEKGYGDYNDADAARTEILESADEFARISFDRLELKAKLNRAVSLKKKTEPFLNVGIPFNDFKDTLHTSIMLFIGGSDTKNADLSDLAAYVYDYPSYENRVIGVVCKKADKRSVTGLLNAAGFSAAEFTVAKTAKELIADYDIEIKKTEEESLQRLRDGLDLAEKNAQKFKILHDILLLDIEKTEAEAGFFKTGATFTLDGWVPELLAGDVIDELRKLTDKICIESRAPAEGDEPPTYLYNAKLFRPFEPVTENYSPPAYGELDPNPVMAFFFFIFFGIMLGDAGYGVLLSIGCFVIMKTVRLEKGFKQMLMMFGLCGISAVIFGIIFGGVFSISAVPPLWFNPLKEPLMLLVVSIILGVLQLSAGYTLKMLKKLIDAKNNCKTKKERFLKVFDGLFDALFIYMLFIGIAFLVMPMLFPAAAFPFAKAGTGLLAASLIGIFLTNGRGALAGKGGVGKKIGGYISGGFGGLYNLVSLFSDVLSYLRLFGLALSGAAIGMAFNMIGSMLFGIPVVGYVLGGAVLLALHAFNFALSALSAYVHNIRLQYLEFYGKFYDGEGRLFTPMGEGTKFVRFVEK
jgi:V/A-type H+-transporting ATPase subunit I